MTVTISSTTDTESEVRAAAGTPAPESTDTAAEETAAAVDQSSLGEVSATEGDAQGTLELEADAVEGVTEEASTDEAPVEAVGEGATEDDEREETAESDQEETVEVAPDETPKKKRRRRGRSYKERASQLAREKASEAARADALAAKLAAIEANQRVPTPAPDPPPDSPPEAQGEPASQEKPKQSSFTSYEDYQEALVEWKVSQQIEAHEKDRAERMESDQKRQRQQNVVDAHVARIDAFREAHPDFDAVVEEAADLPVTDPMHDAVLNSESGPALMYHLCKNPEECDRISQMHPLSAIKEMGRLEAQLDVARSTTGPTPKAEPLTKAPRPIKPVGGGVTASTVPLDQMNYQDYKRARERQIAFDQGLPDPYAGVSR